MKKTQKVRTWVEVNIARAVHDGLWPSSSYGLRRPMASLGHVHGFLFFKFFFNDKKEKSKMKKIKVTKEIKITTNKKKIRKNYKDIYSTKKKEKKCIIEKDNILKKIFKSIKKKKKYTSIFMKKWRF